MEYSTNMVLEPLSAIIEDIAAWNPELKPHVQSELERLRSICHTRGAIRTVMSDLPAAGKHLDYCLSRGRLFVGDYPPSLGSIRRGTQIFSDLYTHVFDGRAVGSVLQHSCDETAVFFLRQILYLYKKVEYACPPSAVKAAVVKFFDIEKGLREPSLCWNSNDPLRFVECHSKQHSSLRFTDLCESKDDAEFALANSRVGRKLLEGLDKVVDLVSSMVPLFNPYVLIPRHGPGAVNDLRSGDDKFSFPQWSRKLDHFFPEEYFAYSSEEIAMSQWNNRTHTDVPSIGKIIAVPKTIDAPRLITVESTANQFLQQGLMRWFRQTLPTPLRHSIDFLDQNPSRELAQSSSANGLYATVDLSSASDRLSTWTVERSLRNYGGIIPYLYATRTSFVQDCTTSTRDVTYSLRKFAGQGSAVTFPVQTIIYWIASVVATISYEYGFNYDTLESVRMASRKVRVFGDDIIIPVGAVPYLGVILKLLQLKINMGKSHYEGNFRESCGMDSFRGIDVTPLYLSSFVLGKGSRGTASWTDVSNVAHMKGLWRFSKWMDSKVGRKLDQLIHSSNVPLASLTRHTFTPGVDPLIVKVSRYNPKHHVYEVRGLTLNTRTKTMSRDGYHDLLAFFIKEPDWREYSVNTWKLHCFQGGYMCSPRLVMRREWVPITSL